ncbi:hypothetical protein [Roseivirga sp.]|uniref:hypothetical protein n=1 Tax=Roseivirga sp. TaxID=1964215 RepID=UPI003B523862
MKANRALTSRRDAFNIKEANTFKPKAKSEFRKYRFRQATPQYLNKLKSQLSVERRNELTKRIVILILSVTLGIIIFI